MGRALTHRLPTKEENIMNTTAAHLTAPGRTATLPSVLDRARSDPAYQGFLLLRIGFTVAPILFGLDKFANVLVDWPQYLAPWINDLVPGNAADAMHVVGAVEIVAGLVVAFMPLYGGYLVAAWLGGIIVNLLTLPGYYDVALRDFGLLLAALTLTRLATAFDPAAAGVRRHSS
jgi:hypothetical protein